MDELYYIGLIVAIVIGFFVALWRYIPRYTLLPPSSNKRSKSKPVPTLVPTEAVGLEDEARFNFRNTRWGMTRADVEQAENFASPIAKALDRLIYKSNMAHIDCLIHYTFSEEGRLKGGRYYFIPNYGKGERYFKDFNFIQELRTQRLGEPHEDIVVWLNTTFKKKKEFHGLAFMEGHIKRKCSWLTEQTEITFFMKMNSGKEIFYLDYQPVKKEEEEEVKEVKDTLIVS